MRWLSPLLFVLALAAASTTSGREDKLPTIRVLILDGQNNHNWRATTPVIKSALERTGRFQVSVSSNLKDKDKPGNVKDALPFPPDLDKFDVVLSNYNGAPWPKEFQTALIDRVQAGKLGFVLFHAANNAFTAWPEFNDLIGMGWRNNKFGDRVYIDGEGKLIRQTKGTGLGAGETSKHPFRVTIRDKDHPIVKDLPREWMHGSDQLVHGLRGPIKDVQVLATAYSDKAKRGTGEHEPMAWTVRYGKGRVFHTPMGHDLDGVRCIGFLTMLARGAEWAATAKVTLPVPKDFPTADKESKAKE